MPLKTTADALAHCADQLRMAAAGLEEACAALHSAERVVRQKLADLEARVNRNSERIDAIKEDCA